MNRRHIALWATPSLERTSECRRPAFHLSVCGLLASALLVFTWVGGCAVPSSPGPESYYATTARQVRDLDQPVSLFPGDANVLTDEAIGRILNYRYEPPGLSRVALLPAGMEVWGGWSEALTTATKKIEDDVIAILEASPHVYDAAYLPSVLVPEKRSVPYLREAAARFQADLLFVHRNYCRTFEKYRVFRTDRARALCGVEGVLIDTRTGLVPLTAVTSRTIDIEASADDLNFRETVLRAQLSALAEALGEAVSDVVELLDRQQLDASG